MSRIKLYYNLLAIIEKQEEVICKQRKTIYQLVNENAEKENMLNTLAEQEQYLY